MPRLPERTERLKYRLAPLRTHKKMPPELEDKVRESATHQFRSEGERRIAATLDKYGIPFIYEQKVTLNDNGRIRTFRPDFYLPEFNLYIEYYGRVGNQDYDTRTAKKQTAYAANNINVVSIYPWDLIQDWPNYLFERLPTSPNQRSQTPPIKRYSPAKSKPRYAKLTPSIPRYRTSPRTSYR